MKPSLVLFTAITLLLPVTLASHSTTYDPTNTSISHSTRQGESQRGMGNGLSVLPGGWHDGEVVKRQARQGRVPAISRSTSEPTGDAIPHPQPNCVCDLRNTGGVAGFGSDHGWSASKANMCSLAHAHLQDKTRINIFYLLDILHSIPIFKKGKTNIICSGHF